MLIGLHDADAEHIRKKIFPNLALMKISAYHRKMGNEVEWWNPLQTYDMVYSSKIFDFTSTNSYLPDLTVKGGTGYYTKGDLPIEIDNMYPDYTIYPNCDYAIGYLTRGCPNQCSWCLVSVKEGGIRPYRTWQEVVRQDSNQLVLMDNNILACEHGIKQLESLIGSGIKIDLNQGMDIRLVMKEHVAVFKQLKWIRYLRFSCDSFSQLPYFRKVMKWFVDYKIGLSKVFVYLLVQKDLENANQRVSELFRINKNINIYAQAERNEHMGIVPNKLQLEFAQRYVYGRCYKKETWEQYCDRLAKSKGKRI